MCVQVQSFLGFLFARMRLTIIRQTCGPAMMEMARFEGIKAIRKLVTLLASSSS
jgi:hypothetical protein